MTGGAETKAVPEAFLHVLKQWASPTNVFCTQVRPFSCETTWTSATGKRDRSNRFSASQAAARPSAAAPAEMVPLAAYGPTASVHGTISLQFSVASVHAGVRPIHCQQLSRPFEFAPPAPVQPLCQRLRKFASRSLRHECHNSVGDTQSTLRGSLQRHIFVFRFPIKPLGPRFNLQG